MKSLCCSLLLLAAGCSTAPTWYVDERFSAEERAQIQRAADTWTAPIDLVFGAHVSAFDNDRRVIVRVTPEVLLMASSDARSNPNVKTVLVDDTRILVSPEAATPMWYRVAHELGHGMGLEHVADPSALMYYTNTVEGRGCITEADAAEYARVNGVRIRVGCPTALH